MITPKLPEVKKFIMDNMPLIREGRFNELYAQMSKEGVGFFTRDLTETLLAAGIHPLDYCNEVPSCYAHFLSSLTEINVPSHIDRIGYAAFRSCGVKGTAIVNNGVKVIEEDAFANCQGLERLELPRSLVNCGYSIAVSCRNLKEIVFDGTIDQFKSFGVLSIDIPHAVNVLCTDGTTTLEVEGE